MLWAIFATGPMGSTWALTITDFQLRESLRGLLGGFELPGIVSWLACRRFGLLAFAGSVVRVV